MPNQPNITQITPPRVPIIDDRTGYMTREWYRYFYNLYYATGGTTGGAIPVDRGGTGTTTIPTNGQLLIGNSLTNAYTVNDLDTGPGIAASTAPGFLSIENTGVLSFSGGTTGLTPATATTGAVTLAGTLDVDNGGTGATTAAGARANLEAAKSGANSDITSLSGLTGAIQTPTYIDYKNNVANPAYQQGRVFYDDTAKALSYYNDANGVTINIGQEEVIRVFNNTGADILNGQLCFISGASDEFPEVTLAQADTEATSASTIGMATADIADQEYGYITTSGLVHDVNTATFTAGETLYLSDSVAGGYTNVAPLQPNYAIVIGYVTSIDATTGAIYIHIDRLPWYPNGEIRLTAASTALPTTPTVFTSPSVITQQGISYDNATGVLTINTSGSFTLSHTFNCSPSAANKKVYFYVEESTDGGSTWVIARYSARQLELINGTETQLIIVGSRYYATGTKIRYYLWGDATVTLKTTDLPGTTAGTVTLPAYRLTLAG